MVENDTEVAARFPPIPPEQAVRRVYFDMLDAMSAIALAKNRYEPVHIMSMPTDTPENKRAQLSAVLQGLADGTIVGDTQRLKGVELALKTLGMLTDTKRDIAEAKDPKTTQELIDALKKSSGSTLRTGGPVVDKNKLLERYSKSAKIEKQTGKIRATKRITKG